MKTVKILLIVIILILVAGGIYYFATKNNCNELKYDKKELIGKDKDDHGCMLMAGYSWCEAEQKCLRPWEESCSDYIMKHLKVIELKTGIDFTEPTDTELIWYVESGKEVKKLKLQALSMKADRVSDSDFEKIRSVIESYGFEQDKYNARGGIMGSFGSYRKDNFKLVCTLTGLYSDFDADDKRYEPQTTDKDVDVICAIEDES